MPCSPMWKHCEPFRVPSDHSHPSHTPLANTCARYVPPPMQRIGIIRCRRVVWEWNAMTVFAVFLRLGFRRLALSLRSAESLFFSKIFAPFSEVFKGFCTCHSLSFFKDLCLPFIFPLHRVESGNGRIFTPINFSHGSPLLEFEFLLHGSPAIY